MACSKVGLARCAFLNSSLGLYSDLRCWNLIEFGLGPRRTVALNFSLGLYSDCYDVGISSNLVSGPGAPWLFCGCFALQ